MASAEISVQCANWPWFICPNPNIKYLASIRSTPDIVVNAWDWAMIDIPKNNIWACPGKSKKYIPRFPSFAPPSTTSWGSEINSCEIDTQIILLGSRPLPSQPWTTLFEIRNWNIGHSTRDQNVRKTQEWYKHSSLGRNLGHTIYCDRFRSQAQLKSPPVE